MEPVKMTTRNTPCASLIGIGMAGNVAAAESANIFGIRIPDGTDSMLVANELMNSSREIADSGQYARVEQSASSSPLSPHFAQACHTITTNAGQRLKSYTLLTGKNGYFIKLRMTGPDQTIEPHLVDFLRYLVEDLGLESTE